MMPEERNYAFLTTKNNVEILLYLLSADSIIPDLRTFHYSTHPLVVEGTRYAPCGTTDHREGEYSCIFDEIKRLHDNLKGNPEKAAPFWQGIEAILTDYDRLQAGGELGKYGQAELLEALFNMYAPLEQTFGISKQLKQMIQSERYQSVPAVMWPVFAEGRKRWDLHFKALRAYVHQQRGESPEFWKDNFEHPPENFPEVNQARLVAFLGLVVADPTEAQHYLETTVRESHTHLHNRARIHLKYGRKDCL